MCTFLTSLKSCNWLYLQDVMCPGSLVYYSTIERKTRAAVDSVEAGCGVVLRWEIGKPSNEWGLGWPSLNWHGWVAMPRGKEADSIARRSAGYFDRW
jgi:hypothetical protein